MRSFIGRDVSSPDKARSRNRPGSMQATEAARDLSEEGVQGLDRGVQRSRGRAAFGELPGGLGWTPLGGAPSGSGVPQSRGFTPTCLLLSNKGTDS